VCAIGAVNALRWHIEGMMLLWTLLLMLAANAPLVSAGQPDVVWIVLDEVGTADIGYNARLQHSVQDHEDVPIRTPHIDALALSGARLRNFYAHPEASASRQALLTSRYKCAAGCALSGLGRATRTMAHEMQERGYKTHYVGQWSLLSHEPSDHGFDGSFVGDDHKQDHLPVGQRATDVIHRHGSGDLRSQPFFLVMSYGSHAEMRVPMTDSLRAACSRAAWTSQRQAQCARITSIDEEVGEVGVALRAEDFFSDTLIILVGASSGTAAMGAYNYPFRGHRGTGWEGGMHLPALIFAPRRVPAQVFESIFHVTDWVPTILAMLDGELPRLLKRLGKVHGVDQSESLQSHSRGERRSLVVGCDCLRNLTVLIQVKDGATWKLVLGAAGDGRVSSDLSDNSDIHDKIGEVWYKFGMPWLLSHPGTDALVWQKAFAAGAALLRDFSRGTSHATPVPELWNHGIHDCSERSPIFMEWARVFLFRLDQDPFEQNNLAHEYVDVMKQIVGDHNQERAAQLEECPHTLPVELLGDESRILVLGLMVTGHFIFVLLAIISLYFFLRLCQRLFPGPKPKPE